MIDTHAHVFHRGLRFSPQRRYTPMYDALPEDYSFLLNQHRVSHAVLVPISIVGSDNSFVLETVRAYKGRFKAVVCLDALNGAGQVADFAGEGACGMRLNLMGQRVPDLRREPWRGILQECLKYNWFVEVNDAAGRLSQTIDPLLDAGIRVIIDHFGQPDKTLGIDDPGFRYVCSLAKTRQVWVKLSAPYRIGYENAADAAKLLYQCYGPSQLLWASDWPFTGFEASGVTYAGTCEYLKQWIPEDAAREQIEQHNPAELFGFAFEETDR